ncbi:hypothetical protein [Henriciella aquimarina]|uniref:hypothetical protein n=1 Tax=Henriciella aquimarina TaxID=545261 RepID=UPI001301BC70|nr:hypothetical protein [Henriciella aquimarina]
MSDKVFFAAAALVAMVMVALGLLPGVNTLPTGPVSGGGTDYKTIEVSGDQLNRMVAGGEADIELVKMDGRTLLQVGAKIGTLKEDPLLGPHFVLAQDLEVAFAGRTVQVTINARAAEKYGAEQMRVNYWVGAGEGSGWETFPMTRQFRDISFTYDIPDRDPGAAPGYDYLAIRPVVPEKERAILISSITIEPVSGGSGTGSTK